MLASARTEAGVTDKNKHMSAPKGKAKIKAKATADPIQVACTWRRRTLKDFNKLTATLAAAKEGANRAIQEAAANRLSVFDR